jgi:hypothetical protein
MLQLCVTPSARDMASLTSSRAAALQSRWDTGLSTVPSTFSLAFGGSKVRTHHSISASLIESKKASACTQMSTRRMLVSSYYEHHAPTMFFATGVGCYMLGTRRGLQGYFNPRISRWLEIGSHLTLDA